MNKKNLEAIRHDIYERENFTYLNVSILNPIDSPVQILASFKRTLNLPLLYDPSAFTVALISLDMPSNNIPLFKFVNGAYHITLNYLGVDYSDALTFISYSVSDVKDQFVFYIQQFLDSINASFINVYNLLIAAHPGIVNAAPYIVYQFGKFSLICDGLNYNSDLVNPVKIFFNQTLFDFFIPMQSNTFGLNLPSYKDVQLLIKNNGSGSSTGSLSGTVYTITTEYDPIALWSFVKSVILLSYTGIKKHTMITNVDVSGQSNLSIAQPIIANVEVNINENNRSSYINYSPKFPLYNDIISKGPLIDIEFRIAYLTKDLNVYPLNLLPSQSASMILCFKHKSILS